MSNQNEKKRLKKGSNFHKDKAQDEARVDVKGGIDQH